MQKSPLSLRLPALACWLLLPFYLNTAQGNNQEGISVQISALALDQNISELMFINGESIDELDIFTTTRSRLVRYQGNPQLTFFREARDEEGAVFRNPVGSVTLSPNVNRYLLFFMQRPGDSERYNILALPDDVTNFPPGSFRFVNLAPFRIAVQVGEERLMLSERDFGDVKGRFEHGNRYRTLMISLPEGEDPIPGYSGRLFFNERMRMLYVIFPDPSGRPGQIRFTGIPDAVR
jgi:hypothetical protein